MRKRCGRCRRDYEAMSCPYCYTKPSGRSAMPSAIDVLAPSLWGPIDAPQSDAGSWNPPSSSDTGGGFDGGGGDFGGGGASGEY